MAISMMASGVASAQGIQVWAVDPLTKVFKDDKPASVAPDPIDVARGEMAEWQIVVRAPGEITDLKVNVSALAGAQTTLRKPRVRFVGYVPIDEGLPKPPKDRLRTPPGDFPDPLLPSAPATVPADSNQPIWLDLPIPASAPAGDYQAEVRITGKFDGKRLSGSATIRMTVFPVTVGKSRLWVTNWFSTGSGHMPGSGMPGTKEEDAYLKQIAEDMAAHRQNVAIIPPLSLSKCTWDQAGNLQVDFSRFDAWVGIFTKAGVIGRIEGGHIGARSTEAWESPFFVTIKTPAGDKTVAPDSAEAERFYSQYLPLLAKHLKAKRWWSRYVQHLADEPIKANIESYKKMAALVHKYMQGVKTIEATHTREVEGAIDVWVPQLNFADTDYAYYKSRQEKGDEFWMYTCVYPQGEYANRFIELPLIKTRVLHWINYRYGITGYLHWGFNFWVKGDPFDDLTRTKANDGWGGYLPAGDSWLVYPKDDKLIDSIRFEAMRDGIADYELLSKLGDRDKTAAQKLAERIVLSFTKYATDVRGFRAVRRELLDRLAG